MGTSPSEPPPRKRKLYYKIGEVSREVGVAVSVIRFWESRFAQIKPRRSSSGQRLYRRRDIELLKTIHHLIHEKRYTMEGCLRELRQRHVSIKAGDLQSFRSELMDILNILSNHTE